MSNNNNDDDFMDFLIATNYINSNSGNKPSSSSGGGCFGTVMLVIVVVIALSLMGSCLGCSGSKRSSSNSSYSSRSSVSSSSSERKNSTTQVPGLSHSLFKEGGTVTDSQLEMMEWQGGGNLKDIKTTKYRYDIGDYIYVIWVSDSNRIVKLSTTIRGDTLAQSRKSSSPKRETTYEFDVDDFANAEDFYDWYKDDFVDFEEAEDYYNSHK